MKKLVVLLGLIIHLSGYSQVENQPLLFADASLKTGQLPNGLTYYIRNNPASSGYISFYLVQNVGALLEENEQNGLAHFLEHMAFNGSLHFPGKSMIQMLEQHGVSVGHGINAYTSLNETLYGLDNIPNNKKIVDSCLLILYDWSHFLTLDSQAIESERPIILEEWRMRRNANFRLNAQTIPVTMKGSKYAIRDIIGDTAIIRNFHPSELRKFYHTWYRPDMQAIIIVGDVDIAKTEQQIKTLFADLPTPQNVLPRPFFEIPSNEEFSFIQATDPEAFNVRIRIRTLQKSSISSLSDINILKENLQIELFNRLMNERLYEVFRRKGVPALGYSLLRHDVQRGYQALTLTVIPRLGDEEKVIKAALTEKERVKRFGFTNEELKRVQTIILREAEKMCSEQKKQPNSFYIEKLSQHFLENKPIITAPAYLDFIRQELSHITTKKLIEKLESWDDGSNYTVSVTGPDNMTKLAPEKIRQFLSETKQMVLTPHHEQTPEKLLSTDSIINGKIVKERNQKQSGAKEWILSNGAKVIFKPVSIEQRIALLAFRQGGTFGCSLEELPAALLLPTLVNNYGIGDLDALQLNKILSVKDINCEINIKPYYEAIAGQAPVSELETLLQTIWLRFKHPRFDPATHQGVINRLKAQWMTRGQDPFQRMNDTLTLTLGNYHPRVIPLCPEQFDQVSLEQVKQLYEKKFRNINNFTFIIAGNGEEKQVKNLVEKYIGSIPPNNKQKQKSKNETIFPTWKLLTKIIPMPFTEHRSTVVINLTCAIDYSLKNEFYQDLLKGLIQLRCMKELRERDGSVYSVSVQNEFEVSPTGKAILMIYFDCAPGKEKELSKRVNGIFRVLEEEGPQKEELQKVIISLKTERQRVPENNQYWINTLFYKNLYDVDKTNNTHFEQLCTQTSPKTFRHYLKNFRQKAHQTEFFFKPQ